jgi:hypothetical protein
MMKRKLCILLLIPLVLSGCISRTVKMDGLDDSGVFDGSDQSSNTELIWFWQKAFWNPED